MKKFLSLLLMCVFLSILTVGLTGCKGMVTEGQMKTMIESSLKEKYKEEFKCIDILPNQNFSDSYTGVCYPVNDRELMFEARIYTDGSSDGDYYPTSIAARELSKTLDVALGNGLGKILPMLILVLVLMIQKQLGKSRMMNLRLITF